MAMAMTKTMAMILIQAAFKMTVRMVDVGRFRRLIHSHSRRSVRDFIKTGVEAAEENKEL